MISTLRGDASLLDLPNEVSTKRSTYWENEIEKVKILQNILFAMPTSDLLKTRTVNHRFCNVIGRIIHERLRKVVRLNDWRLIIECYHPSRGVLEKYNVCEYLGTPGSLGVDNATATLRSTYQYGPGWLKDIFAYFRPLNRPIEDSLTPRQAMEIVTNQNLTQPLDSLRSPSERVIRSVNLESHENFSQLIFSASLVQIGPRNGVFRALAEVMDKQTIRIFRNWLVARASESRQTPASSFAKAVGSGPPEVGNRTVWIDEQRTASFESKVEERRWNRNAPLLMAVGEDESAAFSVEITELRISLLHLLLALEAFLFSSYKDGKAMVIGSFLTESEQPTDTENN